MTPDDRNWIREMRNKIATALRIPAKYLEPPPVSTQMARLREQAARHLENLPHIAGEVRMGLHDDTLEKKNAK